jgi:hypothetical protein
MDFRFFLLMKYLLENRQYYSGSIDLGQTRFGKNRAHGAQFRVIGNFNRFSSRVEVPACAGTPLLKPDVQISRIRLSM